MRHCKCDGEGCTKTLAYTDNTDAKRARVRYGWLFTDTMKMCPDCARKGAERLMAHIFRMNHNLPPLQ